MLTFKTLGNSGRLGNQLWQIASTYGIARTLGLECKFPHWDYQPYFKVPTELFGDVPYDAQESFETPLVAHIDIRARLYLQDYNLFKEVQDEIKQWFQPTDLALARMENDVQDWVYQLAHPILSVHVRRGDNATEGPWKADYHPLRPIEYYEESIKDLTGKYENIVVFSDDPDWCEQTFKILNRVHFYRGTPRPKEHEAEYRTAPILDWMDLIAMTWCDHHIISNSTYSWWGAFLSDDPAPIYPSPWFGKALDYIDASLMFPENWVEHAHRS